MAAMGYSQMLPLALKELMIDQSYGLLMNYTEFCYVQYGIDMPFSKKKYHFPYGHYISGTYMNSISVLQIH